jgi:parallel beta-helix repeat protein
MAQCPDHDIPSGHRTGDGRGRPVPGKDRRRMTPRITVALRIGAVATVAAILGVVVLTQRTVVAPSGGPRPASTFEQAAAVCTTPIQALVDAAKSGATVTVPACLARETVTIDKPLTLEGRPGAEIRGSDVWTDWTPHGGTWLSGKSVPPLDEGGVCRSGTLCQHPEQVFRDGLPLTRVDGTSPAASEFALDSGRHVILGADPTGHVLEVTVRDAWVIIEAPDVTVSGFSMRHAANLPQTGAIRNVAGASADTIRDNLLAYAHGADAALDHGNDNQIVHNDIGFGGQLGVHLGGDGTPDTGSGNIVRDNTIHDNNIDGFEPEWEAGGLKATVQTDLVLDGNVVDYNAGPGLWCDIYCSNVTITGNRVSDNTHAGIFYEVSRGGHISGNTAWGNGFGKNVWGWGAGILVSSSQDTEVADNLVAWNARAGISIVSQHRTDWPNVTATGLSVHDNSMIAAAGSGLLFWGQDWDGPLYLPASANHGAGDRYWIQGHGGAPFHWQDDIDSLDRFNATPGEDGGTYLTDAEKDSLLQAAGVPVTP